MIKHYQDSLKQAANLLSHISEAEYQHKTDTTSAIGAHIRHILDHFFAIKYSVTEQTKVVDYENRKRGDLIESDKKIASDKINELIEWMHTLTDLQLKANVIVRAEISFSDTCITECTSSLGREMMFAASHATHHYALIKKHLSEYSNIASSSPTQSVGIMDTFGIAPSTLQFIKN